MKKALLIGALCLLFARDSFTQSEWGEAALGKFKYEDFEKPEYCGTSCHKDFYREWSQAMMSQCYTHEWDEIEYFELAVPHAEKDEVVAGVKAGCNGCHAPLSFLANDVPPPKPEMGSRANESAQCDVCHTMTGFEGDTPYNFNYMLSPGKTKYSSRKGEVNSPAHEIVQNDFFKQAELCGTCHNEKSPYGVWVKSTHLEWKEGPYSEEGVRCQDCHMPAAPSKTAAMGAEYKDARHHLFHGAHDPGKVKGTVEVRIHPDILDVVPGEPVQFTVVMFNQKTGHKFPTGSVEDRIVWLHVEAEDAEGNKYHLPVDKKGFEGEEYTISSDVLAYQDMGLPLEDPNFKGVQRDGVPFGDRIFRMPYFDPQGRMTIMQWNTKTLGVDYRFDPRGSKIETFTFNLPYEVAVGEMKVTATVNYCRLVKPVAELLKVPAEETEIIKVGEHFTTVNVLP